MTEWFHFLRRPRFTPQEIRRYQDARVRRLVQHAWQNIPYYRRLFDGAGIRPGDIRTAADLVRIPVSRKKDLQRLPDSDRMGPGVDPGKCITFMTSGSTGEPLRFLRTRKEEYLLFGFRLRAQMLAGVRPGDRRVKLGGMVSLWPHRIGLFRISAIDLNVGPAETLRRLKTLRPDVIQGIPNMFQMLINVASREELRTLRPRLILSGAELLTPSLRRDMEDIFQCTIADFYGCQELNLMAWECKRCGLYHTCDDSTVIEVLKQDGEPANPGEEGEVVGTALHSYAMPIIRMEIGDIVSRPAQSGCNIGFSGLEQIRGRTIDFLILPDGRTLSPYPVVLAVDATPGVHRFQIVQEAPDRLTVLFIPMENAGSEVAQSIVANCRAKLPPDVAVAALVVADIPLTSGGKHRILQAPPITPDRIAVSRSVPDSLRLP